MEIVDSKRKKSRRRAGGLSRAAHNTILILDINIGCVLSTAYDYIKETDFIQNSFLSFIVRRGINRSWLRAL